jgi:GNAT superfamily N-acetyltransferase
MWYGVKALRMYSPITIRAVTSEDFEQWLPLWDGYNAFYGRKGDTALAPEVTRTTWARFLDAAEPMHALVAVDSHGILGLAHFLFHRSTSLLGPSCYLQDLFTVEAARGQGIGGALIEAACVKARAGGAASLYWHTHQTNKTAQRLYDRVAKRTGFIVYRKVL